ncbi:MAG: Cna B-type domain-containing protein [Lachnospiraceae bacterium]|nr:Cna B-type domain-containing protein [Lachnospiraceae bacterium]
MIQSKHGIRFIMTALFACVLLLLTPQKASAAETNTLTLHYSLDETTFSVYRVGEYTDQYTLTGAFADYAVEVPGDGWREAAATLEAYALRDGIEPDASGQIAKEKLVLTGLEDGLYLILGESGSDEEYVYTPVSSLILIEKDLEIVVKCDQTEVEKKTVSYTVKKDWKVDSESVRPDSVTVQLIKEDGSVEDTATLNEENGWTYTWTGLDANENWLVTEAEVPEGYTVSVSLEGTVYTVTNTYHEEEPEEPTPEEPTEPEEPVTPTEPTEPEEPTPTEPETPTPSEEEPTPTEPETSSDPETSTETETVADAETTQSAQTGDTAPVNALLAVVLAAGVIILILLFAKRKQDGEENEVK